MVEINDVVEVYKWKKLRYLGKVVGLFPVGNNLFYKVSVLTEVNNRKSITWMFNNFSTSTFHVDVVPANNVVKVCDGVKSELCEECKHRFRCFATW